MRLKVCNLTNVKLSAQTARPYAFSWNFSLCKENVQFKPCARLPNIRRGVNIASRVYSGAASRGAIVSRTDSRLAPITNCAPPGLLSHALFSKPIVYTQIIQSKYYFVFCSHKVLLAHLTVPHPKYEIPRWAGVGSLSCCMFAGGSVCVPPSKPANSLKLHPRNLWNKHATRALLLTTLATQAARALLTPVRGLILSKILLMCVTNLNYDQILMASVLPNNTTLPLCELILRKIQRRNCFQLANRMCIIMRLTCTYLITG